VTFTALSLQVDSIWAEPLSDALLEAGALSVTCEDAHAGTTAEVARFDEPGEIAAWPRFRLTALCPSDDDAKRMLWQACTACGFAIPAYEVCGVADEDWVAKSREQFAPIRVSGRLWVVPTWHEPPDPGALNLVLDPGLAFGTGSHPTTRLCLQWLEQNLAGGETVLDYGCGSGILAIAALRLGAGRAVGVDIDAEAVIAASANARRNGVTCEFIDSQAPLALDADLVVANILANPLKVLAPLLVSHCVQGGHLALSGILAPQAGEIESCYAPWIDFGQRLEAEGWVCLSGVRR
jgi:ribosomal protein L11 methyltransferase